MSLQHVKYIVLVLSGKGGVGKSSVTTQLALSLNLQGYNVGILDVDLTGPSMPRLLGIEDSKVTQVSSGWTPVKVHDVQELPLSRPTEIVGEDLTTMTRRVERPNSLNNSGPDENQSKQHVIGPSPTKVGSLCAMSLAFLLTSRSTAVVWRGPKKTAMIRQFLSTVDWPEGTDYLLVDTPPGTSDEHISLVETLLKEIGSREETRSGVDGLASIQKPDLAGAVIVTTPQAVAVSDVRKELNFCAKTGVKVLGVVENMSGYVCPCCGETTNLFSKGGGQIMATDFGVPFLGSIPVDPLWGVLVEEGKRPKYEKAVADDVPTEQEDPEGDDEEDDVPLPEGIRREREAGLLVDKYRDCLLSRNFAAVAHEVHDRVINMRAVSLT